jgi:hypothetical protein
VLYERSLSDNPQNAQLINRKIEPNFNTFPSNLQYKFDQTTVNKPTLKYVSLSNPGKKNILCKQAEIVAQSFFPR